MKHPPSTYTARERGFTAQSCRSLKDEVGYKRPHAVHPATPIKKLSQTPAYRSVLLFAEIGRPRRCSLRSVSKFRGKRDTLSLTRKTR